MILNSFPEIWVSWYSDIIFFMCYGAVPVISIETETITPRKASCLGEYKITKLLIFNININI